MNGEEPSTGLICSQHVDSRVVAAKIVATKPNDYRLGMMPNGTTVLQGAFAWQQGSLSGVEWKTIPKVHLDASGKELR